MGQAGRRYVIERFAWPRIAEKMEGFYATLMRPD
jgi:hypothetical protein